MEKELTLSYIQHYPMRGENAIKIVQLGDEPEILKVNGVIDIDGKLVICANDNDFDYNSDMKLLLRPMSDLCKPLEDGTIPIVELAKIALNSEDTYDFEWNKEKNRVDIFLNRGSKKYLSYAYESLFQLYDFDTEKYVRFNQLALFEYLFKHHFNVFNLSPDLYIDIKTIEK